MQRSGAILLHISSLPSARGIGTLGEEALRFVNFLARTGTRWWQMLPVGPTGLGDSPYQSPSTFAGNPLFIDLDDLIGRGLLTEAECDAPDWGDNPAAVDFERLAPAKEALLRLAFSRADQTLRDDVAAFAEGQADWLDDYVLYMSAKKQQRGTTMFDWPTPLLRRERSALDALRHQMAEEIDYRRFEQFLFFWQFARLRAYANTSGVGLIGDLPIYVSPDSADVWARPDLFELDENRRPRRLAGVPPDAFTADGQLWGNPLYDWDAMAANGYSWWEARLRVLLRLFDMARIDHFRGFDAYWAVPAGSATAKDGSWCPGPGMALFTALRERMGPLPIIAEDLGVLTDSVTRLREDTGFPGMKVLQFAFSNGYESDYLPHRMVKNAVAYTGTHDNDTIAGYFASLDHETADYCRDYLGLQRGGEVWGLMRAAWASVCDLAVTTAQDLLELPATARMNTPGTMGPPNWRWRLLPGALDAEVTARLEAMNRLYFRG